jgi:hypothetical protein
MNAKINSRIEPAKPLTRPSAAALFNRTTGRIACSKRWDRFSLSPGERAGVRASVNTNFARNFSKILASNPHQNTWGES